VSLYLIIGVVVMLAFAALIVHLFLTWSRRRGWFSYNEPEE
jgi:hypothetical protein